MGVVKRAIFNTEEANYQAILGLQRIITGEIYKYRYLNVSPATCKNEQDKLLKNQRVDIWQKQLFFQKRFYKSRLKKLK